MSPIIVIILLSTIVIEMISAWQNEGLKQYNNYFETTEKNEVSSNFNK